MKLHENKSEFKELITLTAQEKHIPESAAERDYYEHLHEDLLYTDKKQNFDDAVSVFDQIDRLLIQIGE